jgi:hypothetical protein
MSKNRRRKYQAEMGKMATPVDHFIKTVRAGIAVITEQTKGADTPLRGRSGPTQWSVHAGGAITFDKSFEKIQ